VTIKNDVYGHLTLDDHEVECLMVVRWYRRKYGYPPLYEEIAEQTELTKSQVKYSMKNLEELGYIVYGRKRGRGYVVTVLGESLAIPNANRSKKHEKYDDIWLTDVEYATMRGINELISMYQVPPTYSEVMTHVKAGSTAAVAYTVKCLREKGYLYPQDGVPKERKVIMPTQKGINVGIRLWMTAR